MVLIDTVVIVSLIASSPAVLRWSSMRRRRTALVLAVGAALVAQVACTTGPDPARVGIAPPPARGPAESGPVLFVSPAGSDQSPGTREAPLRTLAGAASLARPGTTVQVAPGEYRESLTTRASGRADARIAYTSVIPWEARIVADEDADFAWRNDGDFVDIVGFDITGDSSDGLLDTGSNVRITGNRVHGFENGSCIFTYSAGYALRNVDIVSNVVSDCGSSSLEHGIYPAHAQGTISNNMSFGNSGYGIHCWHACNALTISNNLVFDNGDGGILVGQGDAPNYGDVPADNLVVSNNIAYANRGVGIVEYGATGSNNRFLNNSVADNEGEGMSLQAGGESGTSTASPEFVDFQPDGSGDYRLEPSSPLVDSGTSTGAPATDIAGAARPLGAGYDVGPYER